MSAHGSEDFEKKVQAAMERLLESGPLTLHPPKPDPSDQRLRNRSLRSQIVFSSASLSRSDCSSPDRVGARDLGVQIARNL